MSGERTKWSMLRKAEGILYGAAQVVPEVSLSRFLQLFCNCTPRAAGIASITNQLEGLGIATIFTTVRRMILGQGAYAERLICRSVARTPKVTPSD